MPNALNKKDRERLQSAVDGRNSSQGYVFGTKADFKSLASAGLVEVNESIKDGDKVAMRATDAGVAALGTPDAGTATAGDDAAAASQKFNVRKGIAIPAVKRQIGGATGSKYPFDTMEVGDSFHVAKSADMENPSKSMASSVTAANTRYSTKGEGTHTTPKGNVKPNLIYNRTFQVRAVDKSDPDGEGARIWRTK